MVLYEVGNVLTKHPSFTSHEVERAFGSLLDLGLNLRSSVEPELLKKSFEISRESRVTFYDATYVALAKQYNTTLITADKELYSKISHCCNAKLLSKTDPDELSN